MKTKDKLTRDKSLVWASSFFLSTQFPPDLFEYADDEDVLEFIEDHCWEVFEQKNPQYVWDCIECLADDARKLTKKYC